MEVSKDQNKTITEIILYCSETEPGMNFVADCINCIHIQKNKWRDIGYHYVIRRNGAIEHRKPLDSIIRICLAGGLSETGIPENNFTPEQFQSAQLLISSLVSVYPTITKLSAHDVIIQTVIQTGFISIRFI